MKVVLRILFAVVGVVAAVVLADRVSISLGVVLAFLVGEAYFAFFISAAVPDDKTRYVAKMICCFRLNTNVCYAGTSMGELCIFDDKGKANLLAEYLRRSDPCYVAVEIFEPGKEYKNVLFSNVLPDEFMIILME